MANVTPMFHLFSPAAGRARVLARDETALLVLRELDPFAQQHPLCGAILPLTRLELDAWRRIPRRDTLLVLYGEHAGQDLAPLAAARLVALGYTQVHLLDGGLAGWLASGGEVFRDVNVPSKSFGELVEHERHTPSLPAQEVLALIDAGADAVILDARRFDEYQTMNIPGSTSVPGAELVLRARALAPDPTTRIIVNCAGRTRSIIGTQSLVNAGLPNPVAALRNGTIGWTLAGQTLEQGAARRAPADIPPEQLAQARADARRVAQASGVRWLPLDAIGALEEPGRTVYRFDVRSPEEYAAGHLPGFANAPGGQLVQETDHQVPVRGARIVLADGDGVRAAMTASWLAQMGWDVVVVQDAPAAAFTEQGVPAAAKPPAPAVPLLSPAQLLAQGDNVVVLDVGAGLAYLKRHIQGAWYAIRAQLEQALQTLPPASGYVLTCPGGELARWAAADLRVLLDARGLQTTPVWALEGGNAAAFTAGVARESGESRLAVPRSDRYRRPYEGTDAPREAMQAYLEWEFGLVAQLGRDGTHNFKVL